MTAAPLSRHIRSLAVRYPLHHGKWLGLTMSQTFAGWRRVGARPFRTPHANLIRCLVASAHLLARLSPASCQLMMCVRRPRVGAFRLMHLPSSDGAGLQRQQWQTQNGRRVNTRERQEGQDAHVLRLHEEGALSWTLSVV